MTDRAAFFEAILLRVHARMRLRPPYPLSARDVDAWLAERNPALLAEAERETTRWIALLNRLAELAEALIAADLRRLAHWCYAWGYALDPLHADDPTAQQQVRANLALSAMLHPTLAGELRETRLDLFAERLGVEVALAERAGADLRRALPVLRRLVELAELPASRARLPKVAHVEPLNALAALVWPFHLPRVELLEPVTAYRLAMLGVPDAEISAWLPRTEPWLWVWTQDLAALTSWLHRKTAHFRPLHPKVERALDQLDAIVGPVDPDAEDHDRALTRALTEALGELHVALHVEGRTREEALVAAFLAAIHRESDPEPPARRAGLLPNDTGWIHANDLPELLSRVAGARYARGVSVAMRSIERIAGLTGGRP